MFNRSRTIEKFQYDIDSNSARKTESEKLYAPGIKRSDLPVIDNCPDCGNERIINYIPEQRFDVDNGVSLCEDCHDAFHVKYGKGNNTKEQYEEWI